MSLNTRLPINLRPSGLPGTADKTHVAAIARAVAFLGMEKMTYTSESIKDSKDPRKSPHVRLRKKQGMLKGSCTLCQIIVLPSANWLTDFDLNREPIHSFRASRPNQTPSKGVGQCQ